MSETQSYKKASLYEALPWIACAIGCLFAVGFHFYVKG